MKTDDLRPISGNHLVGENGRLQLVHTYQSHLSCASTSKQRKKKKKKKKMKARWWRRTWEAETSGSLSWRPAWSTNKVCYSTARAKQRNPILKRKEKKIYKENKK